MIDSLLPLILVMLAVYLWHNGMAAREFARRECHALCAKAGLQLLDQTVALSGLRLIRVPGVGLRLRRSYRFEVSVDGHDRHRGNMSLLEGRVLVHSLPIVPGRSTDESSNVLEFVPRPTPSVH